MSAPSRPDPSTDELRATIALAVPVVLVQVGLMLMGVVDTLMVGHVSATMLAAVALGNLYFFTVSIFGMGTLMALDPIVAQAIGARDEESVARAMQRGLVLVVVMAAFTALLMAPAPLVLTAFRQPAEIVPDASRYVRISISGLLPFFAFVVLRQSLQAMGRVAPIVWTIVAANATNVALNWVLIFGHLGVEPLGVAGSAIATAISRWLMTLLLVVVSWKHVHPFLVPVRAEVWRRAPLWRMLKLGAPIGAQQTLEGAAFGAIGLLMGTIGIVPMAAHPIALSLAALTFMVPLGVASAAAVRVGRAIGAGDEARARGAIRAAYVCGIGFMAATAVVFLAFPVALARAFTGDASVVALAAVLIPVAGVFQVFDGAQAVGAGVLRGAGDTTVPFWLMLAAYWLLGVPVSVLLGFRTRLGAVGLWWGFVASLSVVAVVLFARIVVVFKRELRRVVIDAH
jgi:MATE family multidrug resistance protein